MALHQLVRALDDEKEDVGLLSLVVGIAEGIINLPPEEAARILSKAMVNLRDRGRLDMAGNLVSELAVAVQRKDVHQWHLDCSGEASKLEEYQVVFAALTDALKEGSLVRVEVEGPGALRFPYRRK